eukprot:CAMPEP_0184703274 /NCGR_PEP_ID=MMETSP0313-20130426/27201_1 /TAXON_ID=2792 /ORGANISM="Porphyridium aerugineum, Strain SAG 1380-2" /LENGTH=36 /DNA_ID= /DNA_START= /DNA_END= /DNA_ORIENTATION=
MNRSISESDSQFQDSWNKKITQESTVFDDSDPEISK